MATTPTEAAPAARKDATTPDTGEAAAAPAAPAAGGFKAWLPLIVAVVTISASTLVASLPLPAAVPGPASEAAAGQILTPLMRMRGPDGVELSFFATVATFGTAVEVTTSELSIELTFPADAATAQALRQAADSR